MKKLLFAINHKKTEDMIEAKIADQYLVVGAVTYREAVLDKLASTGADTLLIRETLSGSLPIDHLLRRVRVQCPEVRIVLICQERPTRDPFLKEMVGLGIYDIINLDRVSVDIIISYLLSPRTYRDAAQYGIGLSADPVAPTAPMEPAPTRVVPQQEEPKKKGAGGNFMTGIKELIRSTKPSQKKGGSETQDSAVTQAIPQVNMELIQESMHEAEMRKAQSNLDAMIQQASQKATEDLSAQILVLQQKISEKDALLATANQDLITASTRIDDMKAERDKLQVAYTQLVESTKEGYAIYERQLKSLRSEVNTPEWYQEQSDQWARREMELIKDAQAKDQEIANLKADLASEHAAGVDLKERLKQGPQTRVIQDEAAKKREAELTQQIRELQEALQAAEGNSPDYSSPQVDVPTLPDNLPYEKTPSSVHVSIFLGGKHGVGATTVALNIATGLAMQGKNVLLVEFNNKFPMLNQLFELTHISYGIEETFAALSSGANDQWDEGFIRMHGITSKQRSLAQAYRRLPAGLHLLLPSNTSLTKRMNGNYLYIGETVLNSFVHILSLQKRYSHILLDVQCDDMDLIDSIVGSGIPVSDMNFVLTQDPHAIASVGRLFTYISRTEAPNILVGSRLFITRFNKNASITQGKIEKMLHRSPAQTTLLSEDSSGYLEASSMAVPYILDGRFRHEYTQALGNFTS